MNNSRRKLLIQSLKATPIILAPSLLSACQHHSSISRLPGTPWPHVGSSPKPSGTVKIQRNNTNKPSTTLNSSAGAPGNPIPRRYWTASRPNNSLINPMLTPIHKITIHHDGLPMPADDDSKSRLEMIRYSHVNRNGWADIGYHFIVDRAGKVWEGRPINFQGAHVKNNNEHNIGVLCLGNFEIQQPSSSQLNGLAAQIAYLRRQYRLSINQIYTHQEINPTKCPGRYLQPRVASMRSHGAFA